jgi:hypothetical protein
MVNELENIKKYYEINKNIEETVNSVVDLFKNEDDFRLDVALCVFEDNEEMHDPLYIAKWMPYVEEQYTLVVKEDILMKGFSQLYNILEKENSLIVKITKEIFDKKSFNKLEKYMFANIKNIVGSTMKLNEKEDFDTQKASVNNMSNYHLEEYKNSYYKTEVYKIIKEVSADLLSSLE